MRYRARRASMCPSHTVPPGRDAGEATFRQRRHDY